MRISTDVSAIGNLVSLYGAMSQNAASTYGGSTTSSTGFGPATQLSLGQTTSQSLFADTYTFLTAAGVQLSTPELPQATEQQQKEEQATAKQANYRRLNGDYDGARRLLEGLLDEQPTSAVATHGLGAIELDLGNYEKAEQYFRKADYLNPGYGFDTDAANARTLQRDDEYVLEQAEKLSQRADTRGQGTRLLVTLTKRSPANAVARTLLAENLIRDGDAAGGLAQYQAAISTANRTQLQAIETRLTSLVKEAPKAAYLQNLLGQTELKLGKHEQAAETLALATKLSEDDPLYQSDEALAHIALGRDAVSRGDLTTAMREFNAAYGLDATGEEVKTGLAEGYLARGQWLARIGDLDGAIDEFALAKTKLGSVDNDELRSELAGALYSAGRTLERRRLAAGDKVGDEITAFQAAYDLDPDNRTYKKKLAETRNTIGDEYLAEGKLNKAAQSYESAYQVDSDNDAYKTSAISAYQAHGAERSAAHDHHAAISAYQSAYDLDKTNETSKFGLAEAFNARGLLYRSVGEGYLDEAAADFLKALELYPDNSDYQDNYDSVT